jgi:hypothetical protein
MVKTIRKKKEKRKDHPNIVPIVVKERGSANNQQMTRQQIGKPRNLETLRSASSKKFEEGG